MLSVQSIHFPSTCRPILMLDTISPYEEILTWINCQLLVQCISHNSILIPQGFVVLSCGFNSKAVQTI